MQAFIVGLDEADEEKGERVSRDLEPGTALTSLVAHKAAEGSQFTS